VTSLTPLGPDSLVSLMLLSQRKLSGVVDTAKSVKSNFMFDFAVSLTLLSQSSAVSLMLLSHDSALSFSSPSLPHIIA
jgi:hypothetical protein